MRRHATVERAASGDPPAAKLRRLRDACDSFVALGEDGIARTSAVLGEGLLRRVLSTV
jgi:hypothetical protein